jgi:hypothetical protein
MAPVITLTSCGCLQIALTGGNAATQLGAAAGDPVIVQSA